MSAPSRAPSTNPDDLRAPPDQSDVVRNNADDADETPKKPERPKTPADDASEDETAALAAMEREAAALRKKLEEKAERAARKKAEQLAQRAAEIEERRRQEDAELARLKKELGMREEEGKSAKGRKGRDTKADAEDDRASLGSKRDAEGSPAPSSDEEEDVRRPPAKKVKAAVKEERDADAKAPPQYYDAERKVRKFPTDGTRSKTPCDPCVRAGAECFGRVGKNACVRCRKSKTKCALIPQRDGKKARAAGSVAPVVTDVDMEMESPTAGPSGARHSARLEARASGSGALEALVRQQGEHLEGVAAQLARIADQMQLFNVSLAAHAGAAARAELETLLRPSPNDPEGIAEAKANLLDEVVSERERAERAARKGKGKQKERE